MAVLEQWLRDKGRSYSLAKTRSQVYGLLVSKVTSFVALPLPLLSFLAIPFVGGSSTTFNLLVFYLTWTALTVSHDPLTIELGGTLLARLVCFVLPALATLAFDCGLPKFSNGIKARGSQQSPLNLGRAKLLEVVVVAIFNVSLAVAMQAGCEYVATEVLHVRSLLRITAAVPLPWTIAKDIIKGLLFRGTLRYVIHRYLLHASPSWLRTWHLRWQHSVRQPFSLVAAYDHPIDHLLGQWLPAFLPACIFRFHVLEWHLLLVVVSLEELFVYSGYAVLPSGIVLPGMARRTEAHFDSVNSNDQRVGNYGHLGVLDFICGSACKGEANVLDDIRSEAAQHSLQQRVDDAVQSALTGMQGQQQRSSRSKTDRPDVDGPTKDAHATVATAGQERTAGDDEEVAADETHETADEGQEGPALQRELRRGDRRKARKA
ncbi:hypothetical protein LTR10_005537 [Elasticomyces elasticus]|nr:hypothetical protein LTR10_005537 [Elasticomyces elasticus]KAK4976273.1 hypothetical protein LTR42_003902 [Elasticomyces elasticus]